MTGTDVPVRVLQSFARPRPTTNPYLVQLVASLPPDVDARTFRWADALRGHYDVLHVHWPEVLLRSPRRGRTTLRRLAFAALLARVGLRRTAVVRTLHNVAPHEPGPLLERALLAWCDRSTTRYVRLNPATPRRDRRPWTPSSTATTAPGTRTTTSPTRCRGAPCTSGSCGRTRASRVCWRPSLR